MRERLGELFGAKQEKKKVAAPFLYLWCPLVAEGQCDASQAQRGASRPTPDGIQEPSMPDVSGSLMLK